jgi:hypothetical protein
MGAIKNLFSRLRKRDKPETISRVRVSELKKLIAEREHYNDLKELLVFLDTPEKAKPYYIILSGLKVVADDIRPIVKARIDEIGAKFIEDE